MEVVENRGVVYEFGEFILDPANRVLFASGLPIHLPAKEFDTLLLLVQNNGRALSKEEMMSAVWEDSFVEEGNLAKQISRLRKVLETDGTSYIETIPKHGYRFSADLRAVDVDDLPVIAELRTVKRVTLSLPDTDDGRPQLTGTRKRMNAGGIFALAVFAILVCLGIFWYWNRETPSASSSRVRSIAVLPFKVVGTDGDEEYLRVGLADAVVTKLSGLKKIVVRPSNAVRAYRDHEPLAAGRALGVDVVLDGNIQRVDQQIRLTVQLISVADGAILWGGKFDEDMTDIFDLQDAISEQVAHAIEPDLTGEERTLLTRRFTTSNSAHDAYVKGRVYWNRRTADDLKVAAEYLETAVKEDPKYALAFAGLADTYSLLGDYRGLPPPEAYEKAREAALKALELDSTLAEAHTSLAYVRMYYYWDWQGAENSYRQAILLNPNYATAHQWYSEYLAAMGRFDEALVEIRRAQEVDPLSPVINSGEVWILYYARRYDEAIEKGRKVIQMNPDFAEIQEYMKRVYDQKRMYREAIASRQMRRKLAGLDPAETPSMKRASAADSPEVYWQSRLEQELIDARTEPPSTFDFVEIYAQLGDKDRAFVWLEKAFEERVYTMTYLKVAPNLDPLRSDPRFANMMRRVGL